MGSRLVERISSPSPMPYGYIPDHRHRFIHSVGNGFIFGGASGVAYHFVRGLRGSPRGARLAAGAEDVLRNAPRHAGYVAACSAVFCSVETALSLARRREDDPWNSIAASASLMGLVNMRRGARAAVLSALAGAALVAVPLGLVWYIWECHSRLTSRDNAQRYLDMPRPAEIYPDLPQSVAITSYSTARGVPTEAPSSTSKRKTEKELLH